MAVGDENEIGRDVVDPNLLRERIAFDERIKQEPLAAGLDSEAGVSVIGEFHGAEFSRGTSRSRGFFDKPDACLPWLGTGACSLRSPRRKRFAAACVRRVTERRPT